MIGFIHEPTGRLGNVLLQYLFLREISDDIGCNYFHPKLKGDEYFEGFSETSNLKLVKRRIFSRRTISNNEIDARGIQDFLKYISSSNKVIALNPPMLGHTFETMFTNPNKYLRVKSIFQNPYFDYSNKFVISLHFRGTDFADWKPEACLSASYYLDSIQYCVDNFSEKNIYFSLFTDDLTIDSYNKVVEFLTQNNLKFHAGNPERNLGEEIYNLSQSDVIVSSPSTFAIASGLIGKSKKIIHSKAWCDYCINQNDRVWIQMLENQSKYYKIEALI